MKKLICYLSVIALMVMATGCQKNNQDVVPPENDGDENLLYSYHTLLNGFCGGRCVDAQTQLLNNGFTKDNDDVFILMDNAYIIQVTFEDTNSDELIEVMDVTFQPSEATHEPLLTFDLIKRCSKLIGVRAKLFSSQLFCGLYGLYTAKGTWTLLSDDPNLLEGFDVAEADGAKFYWIDEDLADFCDVLASGQTYNGMYMQSTAAASVQSKSQGEFDVHFNYQVKPYVK